MDSDIPRWLKDELGLVHMSEADLNSLVFHPRHGSLCRRFVKFLADSTLCSQRYPNVYAKEELEGSVRSLAAKEDSLARVIENLRIQNRTNDAATRDVNFLTEKLAFLSRVAEIQLKSTVTFERIANRPDINMDQVSHSTKQRDYLDTQELEELYKQEISCDPDINITCRMISATEKEMDDVTNKVETMHYAISTLLQSINKGMASVDTNPSVRNTTIEHLTALRVPEFEEIVLDADPEGKALKEKGERLMEDLNLLNQQVMELNEQYISRKNEINTIHKIELGKHLAMLKKLKAAEEAVHKPLS